MASGISSDISCTPPIVGIFAIQGAVLEHADCIRKCGGTVKEIRLPKDFEGLHGIILPGGESTAMAIIGERWGLFSLLKEWVAAKKPIWGTCAGMILLSDHTIKQGAGNESIVGGLDVRVCRNFFGSQIYSFQVSITVDPDTTGDLIRGFDESCGKCSAVFIRAPAILSVGPDVTVLARIIAKPHASVRDDVLRLLETAKGSEGSIASIVDSIAEITLNSEQPKSKRRRLSTLIPSSELMQDDNESSFDVFVAVRQGNVLATAFHPELTEDLRWHRYFMDMIATSRGQGKS